MKQLLLYGWLPRMMVRLIGLIGLIAGFRVRRSLRPREARPPAVSLHFWPHGPAAMAPWFQATGTRGRVPFLLQHTAVGGQQRQVARVDSRGQVEVLFSDLPASGLPGWFHHPCLGMARAGPSRSIGPLPGGSMGFFTIIEH